MPNPREAAEAREALLDAAERYVGFHRNAAVIVAESAVEVIVAGPPTAPAEAASSYDQRILAALGVAPVTSRRWRERPVTAGILGFVSVWPYS